jgi:hypothetical protein
VAGAFGGKTSEDGRDTVEINPPGLKKDDDPEELRRLAAEIRKQTGLTESVTLEVPPSRCRPRTVGQFGRAGRHRRACNRTARGGDTTLSAV